MKTFRGTWVALGVMVAIWLGMRLFENSNTLEPHQSIEVALFSFEKEEVVAVDIERPSDTIVLAEGDDGWTIGDSGYEASRSMVGRIKHQLHDLTARATVIEASGDLERYGLGTNGVNVTVYLRGGTELSFVAGDPNPTGVSHYILPLPGNTVYTVKKSAVDFFSLDADQFREARFASFDTALVDQVEVLISDHETRLFRRGGTSDSPDWELVEPLEIPVATETVRALIGRVTQLRAETFEAEVLPEDSSALAQYGLDSPRAELSFAVSGGEPVVLQVGAPVSEVESETLSYMMLAGRPSVFVARHALLDDFSAPVESFRSMRFVGVGSSNVAQVSVTLFETNDPDNDQLAGSATIMFSRDAWVWGDGAPVSGSTPERVATRTSMAEASGFVAEVDPSLTGDYGFDSPTARVDITDNDGVVTSILVGGGAEPVEGLEGRASPRWYAGVDGREGVYLVGEHTVSVLRDLIREHSRKLNRDAEHLQGLPSTEVEN